MLLIATPWHEKKQKKKNLTFTMEPHELDKLADLFYIVLEKAVSLEKNACDEDNRKIKVIRRDLDVIYGRLGSLARKSV